MTATATHLPSLCCSDGVLTEMDKVCTPGSRVSRGTAHARGKETGDFPR